MLEIISVLARPGTPSRMQWPWQNRAISTCLRTSFWPTMTAAELLGHLLVDVGQLLGGLQVGSFRRVHHFDGRVHAILVLAGRSGWEASTGRDRQCIRLTGSPSTSTGKTSGEW